MYIPYKTDFCDTISSLGSISHSVNEKEALGIMLNKSTETQFNYSRFDGNGETKTIFIGAMNTFEEIRIYELRPGKKIEADQKKVALFSTLLLEYILNTALQLKKRKVEITTSCVPFIEEALNFNFSLVETWPAESKNPAFFRLTRGIGPESNINRAVFNTQTLIRQLKIALKDF